MFAYLKGYELLNFVYKYKYILHLQIFIQNLPWYIPLIPFCQIKHPSRPREHILRALSSLTGKLIKNKINPTPQGDFVGWKAWKKPLKRDKEQQFEF